MMMMQTEIRRLASYSSWPETGDTTFSLITLARHGFWYTGKDNEVECFSCKARCSASEDPIEKHRERSQCCEYLKNAACNIPLKIINCNNQSLPILPMCKESVTVADDCGTVDRNHEITRSNNPEIKCPQSSPLSNVFNAAFHRARKKGLFPNETGAGIDRSRPNYELLKIEENRLDTFYDWPKTAPVEPTDLAREGLFYLGSDDRVECVFCKIVIRNWEPTDVPSSEHRKHSPECPFVRDLDVGNVPIFANANAIPAEARNATTVRKPMASSLEIRAENFVRESTPDQLASASGDPPKFPNYSQYVSRIETFRNGVVGQGQKAEDLAAAGWFHVGPGDKVRCFDCGGNLRDWEPDDNPWTEHKRWYKECRFMKTSRPPPSEALETLPLNIPASENACSYRIEPREVKARMDTPTVRAILDMGYSRDRVKAVIETRLSTTGDDFTDAESLLEALFQMEDATAASQTGATASSLVPGAATNSVHSNNSLSSTSTSASSTSRSSGYSSAAAASLPSAELIQSELAPAHYKFSKEAVASMQAKTSAPSGSQSVTLVAEAVMTRVAEASQAKPKAGKKKRNKKKKQTAATSSAIEEEDQAGDELADDVQDSKEKPFVDGEHSLEEIPDEEAVKYLEENRQLREARTCKVCMDAEVNTVFLPCGHLVCCATCSPHLRSCPICRTFIRGTVKTFLS